MYENVRHVSNTSNQWYVLPSSGYYMDYIYKRRNAFSFEPLRSLSCHPSKFLQYNQRVSLLCTAQCVSAPTITGWQHSLGSQQPSALLIVILVHTDQQANTLRACCSPQGVSDEDPFQGLEQSSTQVVTPEGIYVVQFCELDVTDYGTQVSGSQ